MTIEQTFIVLDQRDRDPSVVARDVFADHVLVGLSSRPKQLSSRYFYDDEGSRLFQQITELPEYYVTRAEAEVLRSNGDAVVEAMGRAPMNLVDLGAGDGKKTALLLEKLIGAGVDVRYVPVDISEGAMVGVVRAMGARFPGLAIRGVVGEYFDAVRRLGEQSDRRNVVLFLGSSIGNLDKAAARALPRRLWRVMNHGDHALVGFDLKKDIEVLLAAYNDAGGLTAAFNMNLLSRMNSDLGGDFDPEKFRFFCTYNAFSGAMESCLVSLEAQTVRLRGLQATFDFAPWEPIHTEYSYKFLDRDIADLAARGGFVDQARFYDSRRWFCDALWRAEK